MKGQAFSGQLRRVAFAWRWLAIALLSPGLAGAKESQVPEAESQAKAVDSSESESRTEPLALTQESCPFNLLTAKRLTGDWGGLRTNMEDVGVKFKIDFMNQFMVNMHGGRETKNGHDTAGSYEFNLYLDLEKMNLLKDAEFWIRAKGTWGGDDSDFDREKIGGFFKTNQDVGNEEPIFVDKWHYKQRLFDDRLAFRVGRMEPVKDLFDRSKIIGHEDKYFLNRALVRNATVPSRKGLGLFVNWNVMDHMYVRAAALDAHARDRQTNFNTAFHDEDEFRFFGEVGCKPKLDSPNGKLWGHYRAGTWYDPTEKRKYFNDFGGTLSRRTESGDWGFYVGFDQMVWKENDEPKDKQGIAIAGRYGWSDGDVNRIEHFWAAAVQYEGLVPTRDKDVLGFGVGQGIFSKEYRWAALRADRETVYELYYAIHVAPWLTISPDFQYITNAGGDKGDPHAMVAGLRFKISM